MDTKMVAVSFLARKVHDLRERLKKFRARSIIVRRIFGVGVEAAAHPAFVVRPRSCFVLLIMRKAYRKSGWKGDNEGESGNGAGRWTSRCML